MASPLPPVGGFNDSFTGGDPLVANKAADMNTTLIGETKKETPTPSLFERLAPYKWYIAAVVALIVIVLFVTDPAGVFGSSAGYRDIKKTGTPPLFHFWGNYRARK